MASTKVTRGAKARAEKPVTEGIHRAAERAGLTARGDSEPVTFLRGDLNLAVSELQTAFEELIEAEFSLEGYERDGQVLNVLRRVRNAQNVIGGAS
ncbi:MAG: hypothetical protein ABI548_01620 [Polyangiaceae bacterium]